MALRHRKKTSNPALERFQSCRIPEPQPLGRIFLKKMSLARFYGHSGTALENTLQTENRGWLGFNMPSQPLFSGCKYRLELRPSACA
jgi:hypothetical protein